MLTTRAALGAQWATLRTAGALPALGWVLLVVVAVAAGFGAWAGIRWQRGASAVAENTALRKQRAQDRAAIASLTKTAEQLRQHSVDAALAYEQASARMDAVAVQLETRLEYHRQQGERQAAELAALAARRPDLRELRMGNDVLQHWNRHLVAPVVDGAGPAAAPAATPRERKDPVPGAAPGTERRIPGVGRQPRHDRGAGQQLPRSAHRADRRGERVAGDGMALVLRCDHARRAGCIGMPRG